MSIDPKKIVELTVDVLEIFLFNTLVSYRIILIPDSRPVGMLAAACQISFRHLRCII